MKTLTLPFYDHTGDLSPIINEAMERGATSENNHADPETFFLHFDDDAEFKHFSKALAAYLPAKRTAKLEVTEGDDTSAQSDPVDDRGE